MSHYFAAFSIGEATRHGILATVAPPFKSHLESSGWLIRAVGERRLYQVQRD